MSENPVPIDEAATDGLSIAPPDPRRDEDRTGEDAALDTGVADSMDASDPPSVTQPGGGSDPAPSSGYHEERERQQDA